MTFKAKKIQVTSDGALLIEDGDVLIDNYGNIAVATKISGINKMIYRTEIGKFPIFNFANSHVSDDCGLKIINTFAPIWVIKFTSDVFIIEDISQYSTYTEAFYSHFDLSSESSDTPRIVSCKKPETYTLSPAWSDGPRIISPVLH